MPTDGTPYTEDVLLPLSAISDFVFCPRRAALHRLEQIWEESVSTAEGHQLHDRVHQQGTESRGELRVARGLPLRSLELGLAGVADVIEFRRVTEGGVALPGARYRWQPFPIEYKRGIERDEPSFDIQLCAQALCLEEMLGAHIPAGAIFYGLSRRRHDVAFDEALRLATRAAARDLHALIAAGETPPPVYEAKCKRCSLLAPCMPRIAGRKSAIQHLEFL